VGHYDFYKIVLLAHEDLGQRQAGCACINSCVYMG
jgi:hypothetical protein